MLVLVWCGAGSSVLAGAGLELEDPLALTDTPDTPQTSRMYQEDLPPNCPTAHLPAPIGRLSAIPGPWLAGSGVRWAAGEMMVILAGAACSSSLTAWTHPIRGYKAQPGHPGSSNGCRGDLIQTPDTCSYTHTYLTSVIHPVLPQIHGLMDPRR